MGAETQAVLVEQYIQQMAVLREQVDAAQQQAYAASDQSDDAADLYVATMVPLMAGAQAAAAQLTALYLAYMLADLAGRALTSVRPPLIDLSRVIGPALRNGVAPEVVYRRPFQQVWTDLAKPLPEPERPVQPQERVTEPEPEPEPERAPDRSLEDRAARPVIREPERAEQVQERPRRVARLVRRTPEVSPEGARREKAVEAGQRRSRTTALTDLQLATTHAARDVLSVNQDVVGYRRVLTGAENCGMCIVAATRLYHTRNLMPMHPACDCVVAPVMKGEDPGRTINNRMLGDNAVPVAMNKNGVPVFDADQTLDLGDLLEDAHRAVEERFGRSFRDAKGIDYRKVITVRQHGETGPMLTVARHRFTKRRIREQDLSA